MNYQNSQQLTIQLSAIAKLYHSGQMAKAEQACRELLNTYPQSLVAINVLGAILQGQDKLQEAVQTYNKATTTNSAILTSKLDT